MLLLSPLLSNGPAKHSKTATHEQLPHGQHRKPGHGVCWQAVARCR